ncbi:hypothetical protein E8E13_004053 [Curvularia kusanoi]|uniref:Uncharacterized protein n=1 Tax=Curvularia kusanoi TaxID=90978 RepID=A0A9P4W929_CURKU|nr:hypothetical protein E8E13_004053 [Curvularia kusanoi]
MFTTSLLPLFAAALAATPATVLAAPAADATSECGSLDVGTVLAPFPNDPSSFYNFPYYPRTAENATHPLNYERFMTASHRALSDDVSYLTYEELEEYDVGACARRCDGEKECAALVVRCALFKSSLDASQATNDGEIRGPVDADGESFEVRVAGSNGYNKLISPLSVRARASAAHLTTVTETVTEPAITVTVTTTPTTPKTPTTTPETPTTLETLTTPQPQPRCDLDAAALYLA